MMDPKPAYVKGELPDSDLYGPTCDPCLPFHGVRYTGGTFKFWRSYPNQFRTRAATFFFNTVNVPIWQEDLGGNHINEATGSLGTCSFPWFQFPWDGHYRSEDFWYIKDPPPVANYIATVVYLSVPFWWTKQLAVNGRVELDVFGHR